MSQNGQHDALPKRKKYDKLHGEKLRSASDGRKSERDVMNEPKQNQRMTHMGLFGCSSLEPSM